MLAMQRAVAALPLDAQAVLVDGNRVPALPCPAEAVVKGDGRVPAISAASILAKVARDREMQQLHEQYPQYGFDRHKGYPTKVHLAALNEHGALAEHRRSFGPVSAAIAQGKLFLSEPRFVHLRLHTDYSLLDGVVRVKELIKTCVNVHAGGGGHR